uniref:Transforming growth factor alpha n=1 Tax=Ornithorhynchus anatinus TaxID=9258 RepID=A0A6I8P136_ORNAN
MVPSAGELAWIGLGILLAACQALENTTSALSGAPVPAAVRSHFNECPDSHSQFCFHGTCRFLVEENKPACKCHLGFMGERCEHADLLAVVAATQKKQTITALLVVSVLASVTLAAACVLIQSVSSSVCVCVCVCCCHRPRRHVCADDTVSGRVCGCCHGQCPRRPCR